MSNFIGQTSLPEIGIYMTFFSSFATFIVSTFALYVTKKTSDLKAQFNESEKWSSIFRTECAEFLNVCYSIRGSYSSEHAEEQNNALKSMFVKSKIITLLLPLDKYTDLESNLYDLTGFAKDYNKQLKQIQRTSTSTKETSDKTKLIKDDGFTLLSALMVVANQHY